MTQKEQGQHGVVFNRYHASHDNPEGPGDSRPTATQIIVDEHMEGQLNGKTVLITGCSSGLGIQTARALSHTGATLVLAVRDMEKGRSVIKDFESGEVPVNTSRMSLLHLDLNSLASVRQAATDFLSKHSQLNILINNAGLAGVAFGRTADGFETHLGVNHLAHFLLTMLLMPLLEKSSTPQFNSRVIAVSSLASRMGTVQLADPNWEKTKYNSAVAYGSSKTANIWMANELERRYATNGVHAISLHPGGINTGLSRFHEPEYVELMQQYMTDPDLMKTFKNEEQGAATTVLAAVARDFEGKGGLYLEDCEVVGKWNEETPIWKMGFCAHTFDEEGEKRLWAMSSQMVGMTE